MAPPPSRRNSHENHDGLIRHCVPKSGIAEVRKDPHCGNCGRKALLPVATVFKPVPTPALLLVMLGVSGKVSDLILSPGSLPMVELSGKLTPVKISGMAPLTPEDTRRIAYELIEANQQASDSLQNLV
jgi:hypothetical protein